MVSDPTPYVGFVEHKDSAFFVENKTLMPILHLISNNNTAMICRPSIINRQPSRARTCKPENHISPIRHIRPNTKQLTGIFFDTREPMGWIEVFF